MKRRRGPTAGTRPRSDGSTNTRNTSGEWAFPALCVRAERHCLRWDFRSGSTNGDPGPSLFQPGLYRSTDRAILETGFSWGRLREVVIRLLATGMKREKRHLWPKCGDAKDTQAYGRLLLVCAVLHGRQASIDPCVFSFGARSYLVVLEIDDIPSWILWIPMG